MVIVFRCVLVIYLFLKTNQQRQTLPLPPLHVSGCLLVMRMPANRSGDPSFPLTIKLTTPCLVIILHPKCLLMASRQPSKSGALHSVVSPVNVLVMRKSYVRLVGMYMLGVYSIVYGCV